MVRRHYLVSLTLGFHVLEPCLVGEWERGRIAGCLGGWYHYGLGRD